MHPILFKLGPITIHTYGFLLALGVLSAILFSLWLAKKEGLDTRQISDLIFFSILIGLLGAKLFLIFTEFKIYINNPKELINMIRSAGTFYGGLIFGGLFAVWYIRKKKLDLKKIADILAPAIALAHFFGRLGCFSAGCCFGRLSHGFCQVIFTSHEARTTGVPLNTPLYPTQLIESILNLINFIILFFYYKKRRFPGQVFLLYIFNYSIIRFGVEFFRGDLDRGYIFGGISHPFSSLSVPQFISIIGITISTILFIKFRKKSNLEN